MHFWLLCKTWVCIGAYCLRCLIIGRGGTWNLEGCLGVLHPQPNHSWQLSPSIGPTLKKHIENVIVVVIVIVIVGQLYNTLDETDPL